jgi:hypothetical protein
MFHRSHIGLSWSPDALTVAIRRAYRAAKHPFRLIRIPLESGDIDALSGRIVREKALCSALERVPDIVDRSSKIASLSMAMPSAAAYAHTWTVASPPKPYSPAELARQVREVFPGKSDELVFDIHQHWIASQGITRAMLVVVNREVVQSYIRVLGSSASLLVRTTTAEIARYNMCCQLNPALLDTPCVVLCANPEYLEVTSWSDGVLRSSRRAEPADRSSLLLKKSGGSGAAIDHEQLGDPYGAALKVALSSVLSNLPEAQRPMCRVVVCHKTAVASVERALHSLSLHGMSVDCLSLPQHSAQICHEEQLSTGVDSEGGEDALGALLASSSCECLLGGRAGTVFESIGNLWSTLRRLPKLQEQRVEREIS